MSSKAHLPAGYPGLVYLSLPLRNTQMNKRMLAWFFCLATPLAQAQMLQPGLWELTSSDMKVDGQQLPDL